MEGIINCNGTIQSAGETMVPAMDHGFLYGDSIYETFRTYRGVPFLLDRHLDRCVRSARGLALEIPWDRGLLEKEIRRTFEAGGWGEALMRVVVTRGAGSLDMHPASAGPSNILLYAVPHPIYPETHYTEGVKVLLLDLSRSSWGGIDPTIKSGSRLANVLALAKAREAGAFEAVMRTGAGHLTEGTSSNFFLVVRGELRTSRVEAGLLPGITRQVVLELAEETQIPCRQTDLVLEDLESAEEAFLTSTTKKVMPIRSLGSREFGTPGPVTLRLAEAFDARVEREVVRSRPGAETP